MLFRSMSWRSATQPLPKEVNPKVVFDRLFGGSNDPSKSKRDARRKSILDFVREDSKSLGQRLASNDVRKLDEYFASIRDIELRIERSEKLPPVKTPEYPAPQSVPAVYEEHIRMMMDLMVLAFQADITRVITFVLANEGSNKSYGFIDVPEGHHDLSHHGGDAGKQTKLRQINTFHTKQLGYFLNKMNAIAEGEASLLDHSMIAYGSGIHDGNAHNHDDLPVLVAGSGCGTLKTGRHLRYAKETPISNLWLAMLDRVEIEPRDPQLARRTLASPAGRPHQERAVGGEHRQDVGPRMIGDPQRFPVAEDAVGGVVACDPDVVVGTRRAVAVISASPHEPGSCRVPVGCPANEIGRAHV